MNMISQGKPKEKTYIIVASMNPVKKQAIFEGFQSVFGTQGIFVCEGLPSDSGVKDQPEGNQETLRGAYNRLAAARLAYPEAAYYAALEGGVERIGEKLFAFAWVVIEDQARKRGEARTGTFELPSAITQLITSGMELGHANDQVFGVENSKHTNGALGILTGDLITRTSEYASATILALIPFARHAVMYDDLA
jgi:inosine/xanthosine triphosphatase